MRAPWRCPPLRLCLSALVPRPVPMRSLGAKSPAAFAGLPAAPSASARPLPRRGLWLPRVLASGCFPLRLAARVASLLPLRPLRVAPLVCVLPPPSPFPRSRSKRAGAHKAPLTGSLCSGGCVPSPRPLFIRRASARCSVVRLNCAW